MRLLRGCALKRPESGPMESRLNDCRGRIRGSAMPARVLSRAAAAKANSPPDFWLPEEEPAEVVLWSCGREATGGSIGPSMEGSRDGSAEDRGRGEVSSPFVEELVLLESGSEIGVGREVRWETAAI